MSTIAGALRLLRGHPALFVPPALYLATVAPTIGLSDTAILVDAMQHLQISTYVNNHNLTVLVGWLFSHLGIGDLAYRANLSSVVIGSLTMMCFYLVCLEASVSRPAATAATLCLTVSHSMWWHSTIVECYAMNALLTVAALHCLTRLAKGGGDRYVVLLFFVAGLALFNHVQMGFIGLGALAVLAIRAAGLRGCRGRRTTLLARCAGACILGCLPYAVTFFHEAWFSGSLKLTAWNASGGTFHSLMFRGDLVDGLLDSGFLIAFQFPSPFLLLILAGAFVLPAEWRESGALHGLATMFLVNTGFFAMYDTWDRFAFLLPSFVVLALLGAFGADWLWRQGFFRGRGGLSAVLLLGSTAFPPWLYSSVPGWTRESGFWRRHFDGGRSENTHDLASYLANPNKRGFLDAAEFASLLFDKLPFESVYVDDDSRHFYAIRLYYQEHYGLRPDLKVHLVNSWGFQGWGLSPEQFSRLLRLAFETDQDLFLVTLDPPFAEFVRGAPALFRRFPLDERRWIYKLLTERNVETNAEGLVPFLPAFRSLDVAVTPDAATASRARATLRFAANEHPFPVRFVWHGPNGRELASIGPFMVAPGSVEYSATLPITMRVTPGRWKVEARVGTRAVLSSEFLAR